MKQEKKMLQFLVKRNPFEGVDELKIISAGEDARKMVKVDHSKAVG